MKDSQTRQTGREERTRKHYPYSTEPAVRNTGPSLRSESIPGKGAAAMSVPIPGPWRPAKTPAFPPKDGIAI